MHTVVTVFKKELLDTLRDRRTILTMVVIPLLMFPILIPLIVKVTSAQSEKAAAKALQVGFIGNGNARAFEEALRSEDGFEVVDDVEPSKIESRVAADELDAVVSFAPDFDEQVASNRPGTVRLYHKSTEGLGETERRITRLITSFEEDLLSQRFARLDLDESVVDAIEVQEVDVATTKEKFGQEVGTFIPYIFIIFALMGAMYPAIDLAAGEKERGTLETLLTAPVGRMEVLLGKFGVVVLVGIASAAMSVVGLYLGIRMGTDIPPEFQQVIQGILDPGSVALVLSLILPLTAFFAGVLLTFSFYARSFKEAQSLMNPLMIVVVIPAILATIPGIKLTVITALIPILNVSLATREIIAGTISTPLLAEVYVSLVALAGISLVVCVAWFSRESVIFRS